MKKLYELKKFIQFASYTRYTDEREYKNNCLLEVYTALQELGHKD